jgi:hypothetical protein
MSTPLYRFQTVRVVAHNTYTSAFLVSSNSQRQGLPLHAARVT